MEERQRREIGARIAALREASGLKQQYIADYCDVKLRTYQFWQEGKHPPSQENLERLAELFNVTTRYILRGPTPQPVATNGDDDELAARLAELHDLIRGLDDELRRFRAEAAVRDAEALKQIEEGFRTIRRSLRPPQR